MEADGDGSFWPSHLVGLLIIIALCVLTEVGFTIHLLPNPDQSMPDFFKWAYAGFKLALTALVLMMVVRQKSQKTALKEKRAVETNN